MTISRRTFIKRAAISGAAAVGIMSGSSKAAAAINSKGKYATLIDLTKCDGCEHQDTPQCVLACRRKNESRFPEPEQPIQDYWPQPKHEDWSDKKNLTNRLTPYNWTYVQHVEVESQGHKVKVHVPRRCMHCDNPPCSNLCPFGVNNKLPEGPVVIDADGCFGGAKCRDVCPWGIPQRQAGVGLYKEIAPQYAGGGVMFKCDMCADYIVQGREPACVTACPNGAIRFGLQEDLRAQARKWVQENDGYLYGDKENGGTATLYISKIPFETIHSALKEQEIDGKPGRPGMAPAVENPLDTAEGMTKGFLIAPIAGILGAGISTYKIMKGMNENEDTEA